MPFTFSHPALVLPLALLPRKWFSLTGLVIGSLTPDFEYFLRMKMRSDHSHTVGGLLWWDLPLGLLLAFLFHNVVRNTLFNNLPQALHNRFSPYKEFNWNAYFKMNGPMVLVSIFIGAASHLLWDSFTHEHGYFVKVLPPLAETVGLLGVKIPAFKILQHASTLLGGLLLTAVVYQLPIHQATHHPLRIKYWTWVAVGTFLMTAFRALGGLEIKMYGHLVATVIAGFMLSLLITPVFLRQKL